MYIYYWRYKFGKRPNYLQCHIIASGVAGIWGPPDYGDPRPNITSYIGTGVTISLSDMRLPVVPIALAVWGSSVIWGPLALL